MNKDIDEHGLPRAPMARLVAIMARLRDPEGGCPWDIEQTYASIAPYTIEEAYEVADAIERSAFGELRGELGDLLLQVVYHARMAEEDGLFDFDAVAGDVAEKMIRRHPHVFGDESRDKSAEQQVQDWEKIKAAERAGAGPAGVLDGVALGLPALLRALKLQKRAARVGFDWTDRRDVLAKIVEEAHELAEVSEGTDPDRIEDEFGDLLFVMVNLGRHLGVDPEAALRRTNAKFTRRFAAIEAALEAEGRTPSDASLAEMDALWHAAKARERG
ncbi:nucleoside triphosphate pyrophosphohydrolase [Halovulum dunhuangense]|uniref:Nucleoside triphosphate pyrophosphohydrolase n=1 Tax=Halovulum dunhuangense TaxID=1505036 RepID=A0A849L2L4_9RHOB|nr:nucleoside triphosphate pyrophosphohydrolase [Halovulum dunhuangense]NNU80480.1 nucleoside triphosphate pyrophosphohydrolase [Halovulum dunhuangense]